MEESDTKLFLGTSFMKVYRSQWLYAGPLLLLVWSVACKGDALSSTNVWGPEVSGVQMSISMIDTDHASRKNAPLCLRIRFRNTNVEKRFLFRHDPDLAYSQGFRFTLTSPEGKDVSPSAMESRNNPFRGTAYIFLEPGQMKEVTGSLSRVPAFESPGTYSIVARRAMYSPSGPTNGFLIDVISNPLKISIRSGESSLK